MEQKRKAGRPPSAGPKLQRVTITLEPADIAKAKAIGAGSISQGVRIALNLHPAPGAQAGNPRA